MNTAPAFQLLGPPSFGSGSIGSEQMARKWRSEVLPQFFSLMEKLAGFGRWSVGSMEASIMFLGDKAEL